MCDPTSRVRNSINATSPPGLGQSCAITRTASTTSGANSAANARTKNRRCSTCRRRVGHRIGRAVFESTLAAAARDRCCASLARRTPTPPTAPSPRPDRGSWRRSLGRWSARGSAPGSGGAVSITASAVSVLSGPYCVYRPASSSGASPVHAPRIDSRFDTPGLRGDVVAHLGVGVGDRPLELLARSIVEVVERAGPCPAAIDSDFDIFARRLLQVHHPRAGAAGWSPSGTTNVVAVAAC